MHLALGIPRRSINGCPLLRVCVHGVCVFTAVCVHFGWVICRARIPSMGHHTWPYVTSLQNSEVHLSQSDSVWTGTRHHVCTTWESGAQDAPWVSSAVRNPRRPRISEMNLFALCSSVAEQQEGQIRLFTSWLAGTVCWCVHTLSCRGAASMIRYGYLSAGWSWSDTMASHTHSLGIGARPWLDVTAPEAPQRTIWSHVLCSKDLLQWGVDMVMWPTASVHNSSPVASWDSKVSIE